MQPVRIFGSSVPCKKILLARFNGTIIIRAANVSANLNFNKNSSIFPLSYFLSSSLHKFLHHKIIIHNKKWNYEEDNILLRRVIRYGWKHWGIISQGFANRSSLDCYYRYRYSLKYLIDYSYINQSSLISLTSKEQQQFWKNLSKTNNLQQILKLRTNSLSLLKQYYIDSRNF